MKQSVKNYLLTMLVALVNVSTSAKDFEVDGIYYNIISLDDLTCEVADNQSGSNVTIPSTVTYDGKTFSVTRIGDRAFWDDYLISVVIPNSVTSIGEGAFKGCDDLKSVSLSNNLTSIGDDAFMYCYNLQSIDIPNSVTSIGTGAFWKCKNLLSVKIPDGVTTIEWGTFYECNHLTSVEIPNSVTSIGHEAFLNCYNLTSLKIPNSVTSIEYGAIAGTAIKEIELGEGIMTLPYYTYYSSGRLSRFGTLLYYYDGDRYNCSSLQKIVIADSKDMLTLNSYNLQYDINNRSKLQELYIGRDLTLGDGDEIANTNLKKLEYGDLCTKEYIASGCTKLEEIVYGKGISSIATSNISEGKLTAIYVKASTPPTVSGTFTEKTYKNVKLYVPENSKAAYKATYPWSEFFCILEEGGPTIEMETTEVEMNVGDTKTLSATSFLGGTVTWSSSDESIATVSTTGIVTAKKEGTVVITATAEDGTSATCTITIKKKSQTISWEQTFENLYEGNEIELTATASSELTIEYAITQGSDLAEIKDGKLVCNKAGEITIEARQQGNDTYAAAESVSKTITILANGSITLSKSEATIQLDETLQLTATSTLGNSVTWATSDEAIATISSDGIVTAKGLGTATITASADNSNSATCTITVTKKSQAITWEQTFDNLYEGNEIELTATASSELTIEYAITQGSDLAEIKDGKLVCNKAGEVTIEARQQGNDIYAAAESVSKTITILSKGGITLSTSEATMQLDETLQLTATSTLAKSIVWATSDESIATVSTDGLVTAIGIGVVTITASAENTNPATCTINVTKKSQTITWEQTFDNIYEGDEIGLTATASSGLPVEYVITNGDGLAEITDGKLVCKAVGEVTIEVRQQGNDIYAAAESVSKTITIQAKDDDTGINSVGYDDDNDVEYFTIDGQKLTAPRKGTINIVRKNGKSKKVAM